MPLVKLFRRDRLVDYFFPVRVTVVRINGALNY